MALVPEGFAQVNFMLTGSQVPTGAQMTIAVRLDTPAEPSDIGSALEDAFAVDNPWELMSETCQLSSMLIKVGPNETGPSVDYPLVLAGADTDSGIAPAVSMLIQKQTAAGGRAGRGRMYMPGFPENTIDQTGTWSIERRNDVSTAWNGVLSSMSTAELPFVVLHGEGSPLTIPSTITSFVVSPIAGTQRRRQRR